MKIISKINTKKCYNKTAKTKVKKKKNDIKNITLSVGEIKRRKTMAFISGGPKLSKGEQQIYSNMKFDNSEMEKLSNSKKQLSAIQNNKNSSPEEQEIAGKKLEIVDGKIAALQQDMSNLQDKCQEIRVSCQSIFEKGEAIEKFSAEEAKKGGGSIFGG